MIIPKELAASSMNSMPDQLERCQQCYGDLLKQVHESNALLEAAKVLTPMLQYNELLRTVVAKVAEMFELADGALICLYDKVSDQLEVAASFGYPEVAKKVKIRPGEGAPGAVFCPGNRC